MSHLLSSADAGFEAAFSGLLSRAVTAPQLTDAVREILGRVQREGDAAVLDLTNRFDRVNYSLADLRVSAEEIAAATAATPAALRDALALAASRIEAFHRAQLPQDLAFTDQAGAELGLRWTPLDAVGIYVPGGKASYPSSVLMNAIPAKVAGVSRIAMCVPSPDGVLNPLVLAAASLAGVTEIYRIGGAQAVAALAHGTASIRKGRQDRRPRQRLCRRGQAPGFRPGRHRFHRRPFGSADHRRRGERSRLISPSTCWPRPSMTRTRRPCSSPTSQALARAVAEAVTEALKTLPRAAIAGESWRRHGGIILVRDWDEAAALANRIAPEHLQIMTAAPKAIFAKVRHAGAVFLGGNCPEAIGDYVAGPNHVLPTSGTARFASGLAVYDFLKRTSWVALEARALDAIGPAAVALAEAESLTAHARSVSTRLRKT